MKKKFNSKSIRINKFIALSGHCSRKQADDLIIKGKVKINGKRCSQLGLIVDLNDFVTNAKNHKEDKNSWLIDIGNINKETWDLTVNNPNIIEDTDNRTPQEILAEIEKLEEQANEALYKIKDLL